MRVGSSALNFQMFTCTIPESYEKGEKSENLEGGSCHTIIAKKS